MEGEKGRLYREFRYSLGETFPTRHGELRIVERLRTVGKGGIARKKYRMECPAGHRYLVEESYLKAGRLRTCKRCNHPVIQEVDPEFAAWFVDPSVPRHAPPFSTEKAAFYCRSCGNVVEGLTISNIFQRRRVFCDQCSDGISYPERFVGAVLRQMGAAFQRQYRIDYEAEGKRRRYYYDFYDEERGLIIETHGQQHFEENCFDRMGGYALAEVQRIDAEKERLARTVLGCGYIWLDCRKSEPEWIRREMQRKLSMYPLDRVDWKAAQQETHTSLNRQIVALYNGGLSLEEIGQQVRLSRSAVYTRLRKAMLDGVEVRAFSRPKPTPKPAKPKPRTRIVRRTHPRKKPVNPRQLRLDAMWLPSEAEGAPIPQTRQLAWLRESGRAFAALDQYRSSTAYVRFLCARCGQVFRKAPRDFWKDPSCKCCAETAAFRERLRGKYGDEIELRGIYAGSDRAARFFHRKCGVEFVRTPHAVMRCGCPVCGKAERIRRFQQTRREKGFAEFQSMIARIETKGYRFEGEAYCGTGKAYPFRCPHCGQIWMTEPYHILQGRKHMCVSPTKKKTHREFLNQVRDLTGDDYTVLTEYRSALTQVQMRHNVCGRTYLIRPAEFTSTGRRCPYCRRAGQARGRSPEQVRGAWNFIRRFTQKRSRSRQSCWTGSGSGSWRTPGNTGGSSAIWRSPGGISSTAMIWEAG